MCEGAAPTARGGRPRWAGLYAIAALAIVALLGVQVVRPTAVRSALEVVTTVATFVAMLGWVRENGSAIDQLDWCDCAAATLTVRVIASQAPTTAKGAREKRATVTIREKPAIVTLSASNFGESDDAVTIREAPGRPVATSAR